MTCNTQQQMNNILKDIKITLQINYELTPNHLESQKSHLQLQIQEIEEHLQHPQTQVEQMSHSEINEYITFLHKHSKQLLNDYFKLPGIPTITTPEHPFPRYLHLQIPNIERFINHLRNIRPPKTN